MQVGCDKISVDIYFIKIKVLVDALSNCLWSNQSLHELKSISLQVQVILKFQY